MARSPLGCILDSPDMAPDHRIGDPQNRSFSCNEVQRTGLEIVLEDKGFRPQDW